MAQIDTNEKTSDRPWKPALLRGFLGRCPSCGQGKLFSRYLKVNDSCPHCSEELHHQRADDGPAYLTILLVSHLGTPIFMLMYLAYRPSPLTLLWTFSLGAVVSSLLLLPRIKGGFVGMQWARRMHGFDQDASVHGHTAAASAH
ncbi:DUF983 domain-containing protein [Paracoccus sp. (in: a-proteobacteria)]|uniref:DUF983 domain-containing protein n=1 Tax=Paracoccus sp. TaxID=267 RepID=UPI0028A1B7A6|nr:DUF983 domain-containing protein [Paracoccus sp. (in: a-proteobacteria)]